MDNIKRIVSLSNPNDHGDGQRSPDVGRVVLGLHGDSYTFGSLLNGRNPKGLKCVMVSKE